MLGPDAGFGDELRALLPVRFHFRRDFAGRERDRNAAWPKGASTVVWSYRIVSNGCNAAACPGAVSAAYVERELALSMTN